MKRKGFPALRGNYTGDQLVKIQINTPVNISTESKNLLEKLDSNLPKIKNPYTKIDL